MYHVVLKSNVSGRSGQHQHYSSQHDTYDTIHSLGQDLRGRIHKPLWRTPNHSRVPCYGLSGLMHTDWRCSTSLPCLLQGPLGREAPTCIQQKCHPRNTMESETCEPTKERHSSSPNAARQIMLDPPWPLCHPPFSLNGTITSTPLCFKTPLNQKWFVAWLVPWARSHPRPTE